MTEDAFERAARRELVDGPRIGFRIHLGVYVAVQLLLVATWALTSYDDGTFGHPWFIYPLLGWGIGLVAHYMAVRATRKPV
jgi:hypothetical protein